MSSLQSAIEIIDILNNASYEAYIVGGFVRDHVIGKKNDDIDIATNAEPSIIQTLFKKTILTGLKHGTVTVVYKDGQYEITTYRIESSYVNNRKPEEVYFVSSLEEDIKRRDFTMNALALSKDKKIIDFVGGLEDIKNKLIRAVGNPYERFSEDALRMMRAFRFVSTLGFNVEEETNQAISKNCYLLKNISLERIIKELTTMITGNNFHKALDLMIETGAYRFLQGLQVGIVKMQETLFQPADISELLAFCAVADNLDNVLALPIPNYLKKDIRIVYEMYNVEITDFNRLLLFRNGIENCLLVNKFNVYLRNLENNETKIINEYKKLPIYKQCELSFKGDDIIELYHREPGAWISEILDEIILKVLLEELENDYQKIRQYLLKKQ